MAATIPFQVITASVSGVALAITPGPIAGPSGTGTIDSSNKFAPVLQITNTPQVNGATASGPCWVRITIETTTASASQKDVCIPLNTVRLFANPAPTGKVQVAVIATLTTSTQIYVMPGQGGI